MTQDQGQGQLAVHVKFLARFHSFFFRAACSRYGVLQSLANLNVWQNFNLLGRNVEARVGGVPDLIQE